MDRLKDKEVIEAMFLSCTGEEQFSDEVIKMLEDAHERYRGIHPLDLPSADAGVGFFVNRVLPILQEKNIKNIPVNAKVGLWKIVLRTKDQSILARVWWLVSQDVTAFYQEQLNKEATDESR